MNRSIPRLLPKNASVHAFSDSVNMLGTSPRFISEVQGRGILPRRTYICLCSHTLATEYAVGDIGKFEALRRIKATGSVLSAPQYGWMQGAFSDRTVISAGCGGTDIFSACTP